MIPENWGDKIMHACLKVGDTLVMASDGCGSDQAGFQGFSLAVTVANEAEADRLFTALGDRGRVNRHHAKALFSPRFGMLVDRFGVSWTVVAEAEAAGLRPKIELWPRRPTDYARRPTSALPSGCDLAVGSSSTGQICDARIQSGARSTDDARRCEQVSPAIGSDQPQRHRPAVASCIRGTCHG